MTGRFGAQTSLDSYLTTLDNFSGEHEDGELEAEEGVEEETIGSETVERVMGAEAGRCGDCGEGSRFERLRLHAGALYLYFKDGRWLARADIDHELISKFRILGVWLLMLLLLGLCMLILASHTL
jgi:hypothetical protein